MYKNGGNLYKRSSRYFTDFIALYSSKERYKQQWPHIEIMHYY